MFEFEKTVGAKEKRLREEADPARDWIWIDFNFFFFWDPLSWGQFWAINDSATATATCQ